MYKTVVFVDFENLQKIDKKFLTVDTKLVVFCGLKQNKPAFDFVKEHFSKPCTIEFIKPDVQGNNALDFCVVFYAGLNVDRFKNAHIIIYSKDKKDYDPLIKHLKSVGMNIERLEYKEIKEPHVSMEKQLIKATPQNIDVEKIYDDTLVHFQVKQTKARPRKIETLKTYLQETMFKKKYSAEIIEQIVELMIENKIVEKNNKNDAIKFNKEKL